MDKPVLDAGDRIRLESRDGDCDGRALGAMVGNYSSDKLRHTFLLQTGKNEV